MSEKKECISCHCTDNQACPGGCYWVTKDLCSNCANTIQPIASDLTKLIKLARQLRFKIKEIEIEDNLKGVMLPDQLLGIKVTHFSNSLFKK